MRGPRFPLTSEMAKAGITPACAGTTQSALTLLPLAWDHPRMCGDHKLQGGFINSFGITPCGDHGMGIHSPRITPHVRGPHTEELEKTSGGSPACAGPPTSHYTEHLDHPACAGTTYHSKNWRKQVICCTFWITRMCRTTVIRPLTGNTGITCAGTQAIHSYYYKGSPACATVKGNS